MPNLLVAGNSTNGGTSITTDTSGTLDIKTGSGSGVIAMSIDASGNVSGVLKSGTAAPAIGTNVDFTNIPSTVKRITVLFNDVSLSGSANPMIRLGTASGIDATTNYFSMSGFASTAGLAGANSYTNGFGIASGTATNNAAGTFTITNISGNTWIFSGTYSPNTSNTGFVSGRITLTGALTQLRCTNNGSDTFDNGTINILYE
jgi:hypothetical protein